jgi:4-amino-4-deoxy-L-arabinose transferase-like glycosyltransferase
MTKKSQVILLLIIGFLLNAAYSLYIAPLGNNENFVLETKYSGQKPQAYFFGDAPDYVSLAINLKNGKGFSYPFDDPQLTARRMPGFPLLLSWIFFFFGTKISIALLFQCLLLTGIFGVSYLLAQEIFSEKIARAGLLLMLFWPNMKFYGCSYLGADTLAVLLFLVFIFCLIKGEKAGTSWKWLTMGTVCFGSAVYAKPEFLIFMPFACIWIFRHYCARLRAALVVPIIIILMLAPWTIRNFLIFDKFIPTTTGAGAALAGSYNPGTISNNPGGWDQVKIESSHAGGNVNDEFYEDQTLKKYALENIKQLNTAQAGKIVFWKFLRLWAPVQRLLREQAGMINLKSVLMDPLVILRNPYFFINIVFTVLFLPIYFLFWMQLFRSFRSFRKKELLIYLFLFVNLLAVVAWGSLRFRFVFEPIIIIFGCSLLFDRIKPRYL